MMKDLYEWITQTGHINNYIRKKFFAKYGENAETRKLSVTKMVLLLNSQGRKRR